MTHPTEGQPSPTCAERRHLECLGTLHGSSEPCQCPCHKPGANVPPLPASAAPGAPPGPRECPQCGLPTDEPVPGVTRGLLVYICARCGTVSRLGADGSLTRIDPVTLRYLVASSPALAALIVTVQTFLQGEQ